MFLLKKLLRYPFSRESEVLKKSQLREKKAMGKEHTTSGNLDIAFDALLNGITYVTSIGGTVVLAEPLCTSGAPGCINKILPADSDVAGKLSLNHALSCISFSMVDFYSPQPLVAPGAATAAAGGGVGR